MNKRDKLSIEYKKNIQYNIDDLWFLYYKKFLGHLIKRGLKFKAINRFSKVLYELKNEFYIPSNEVFLASMLRMTPEIDIKYIRRGSVKQPYVKSLFSHKKVAIATKLLIKTVADQQKNRNVKIAKLVKILFDSLNNKGELIKKKKLLYKIAAANRHIRPPHMKN